MEFFWTKPIERFHIIKSIWNTKLNSRGVLLKRSGQFLSQLQKWYSQLVKSGPHFPRSAPGLLHRMILSPHGDSPLSLQRDTWQQGGVVRLDKCNPHLASLPLPAATCRAMTNEVRELRWRNLNPFYTSAPNLFTSVLQFLQSYHEQVNSYTRMHHQSAKIASSKNA